MSEPETIKERILAAIRDSGGMTSRDLMAVLPDARRNSVYAMIDRLHQAGAIRRTGLPGFRATKYVISSPADALPLVQAMARWHLPAEVDLSKQYE